MERKDWLHRVVYYLYHQLTAHNSKGGGIHSPYLFELVHFVLRDAHLYYVWDDIEKCRQELRCDSTVLDYVDFGVKGNRNGMRRKQIVSEIAKKSLEEAKYAQMLYRLVNWLGERKRRKAMDNPLERGLNIIELGGSLGITTSYLASTNAVDSVVTYEGCPAVAALARDVWRKLGLTNIQCVEGNIDDTFVANPFVDKDIDFAFIDANHTKRATCQYFNRLLEYTNSKSVVVVDDIHYSCEMAAAWSWIKRHPKVTTTMDLYKMGIVFFDPCYLHKHYKIKL